MSGMKIKKNGHGSAHARQVHLARHGVDGHLVDLDTHISCALVECSARCHWDDPKRLICHQRENEKRSHFRLGDVLDVPRSISVRLDSHDDRLGTTRCHRASAIGIIIHPQAHGHNLGLHFANRWEDVRVERIQGSVAFERSNDHLGEIITHVCPPNESHTTNNNAGGTYGKRHQITFPASNLCVHRAPCPSSPSPRGSTRQTCLGQGERGIE